MPSELRRALARYVADRGGPDALSPTPAAAVAAICSTCARAPFRRLYKPSLCVAAQGAKRIALEDKVFDYEAGTALIVGLELPGSGGVTRASKAEPFLGLTIEFDGALLREVLEQMASPPRPGAEGLGVFVERLSPEILDCLARLVRLCETPEAFSILYPALMRELYYRLLSGPNGGEVAKIARPDGRARRIAAAIHLMRGTLTRPLRVEEMAEAAGMGVSSFHQHFKTLTGRTPLQHHKQLRLLEARRLMVAEAANVTLAAFHVGYESPSQFSREYARMFGAAPKRDAAQMKALGAPV